jgi:DNA polymerase-3 subunit epsilon
MRWKSCSYGMCLTLWSVVTVLQTLTVLSRLQHGGPQVDTLRRPFLSFPGAVRRIRLPWCRRGRAFGYPLRRHSSDQFISGRIGTSNSISGSRAGYEEDSERSISWVRCHVCDFGWWIRSRHRTVRVSSPENGSPAVMLELIDTLRLSRDGRPPVTATEFTEIDIETTGLHPGHVVEIVTVRIRAGGTALEDFSTLVNPGCGISPGQTHIHQLTRDQLDGAPFLGDVLGNFLDLCRGSVVVAHNLRFGKRFLIEELGRLGVRMPVFPGVCTLSSSRLALRLSNYRLGTVAGAIGMGEYAAHTALADAYVCAQLVSSLVMTHGFRFDRQPRFMELPRFRRAPLLVPRLAVTPVAHAGWMSQLVDDVPTAAINVADGALEDAYLEMLTDALANQHISTNEAQALAALAADAGMSAEDVQSVHKGFVVAMCTVAEADGIITPSEERDLRQVADVLGVSETVTALRSGEHAFGPVARRVLVLGGTAEADALLAKILGSGIQLAKKLTASVSHLVVGSDISSTESRIARAREIGVAVLEFSTVSAVLGLSIEHPVPTGSLVNELAAVSPLLQQRECTVSRPPVLSPRPTGSIHAGQPAFSLSLYRRWIGRALMGLRLFGMFVTVTTLFGGVGVGLFLAVLGVSSLLGGWCLTEENLPVDAIGR